MAIATFSQDDLNELEEGLKRMAPAGAVGFAPAAAPAPTAHAEFCKIWPVAKPILQLIAKYLPIIPGAGSTASAILNALIDGLDKLFGIVCPAPGP
jgi:hypothetical protein